MKSTRTSLSSRPGSTTSSTKQLSRPSSKLSSTKTYSAPSFKFSYQKKIFTNQKSFTSALLVHISGKKQVVSVGSNKLSLWDLNTFKLLSSLQVNDFEVHNLCYLEHAGLLIGSSWKSRELRIWSLKNGELRPHSRKKLDFTPMCSVSFRKNDIVCTASMVKDLLFWSSCSGKVYSRFCIENGLEIRAMTPVEKRSCVAVGCKDGTVLLVNYLKKQAVMSYRLPLKLIIIMDLFVPFLAYSSSMDLLFAGSCNSNIEVLKVIDKPEKKYLSPVSHKMQLEGVRGLCVLDDEKAVLTCHDNQFLRIWNMQNLQTSEAIAAKVSQAFSMSVDTKTRQAAIADFQAASFAVLNYCITK